MYQNVHLCFITNTSIFNISMPSLPRTCDSLQNGDDDHTNFGCTAKALAVKAKHAVTAVKRPPKTYSLLFYPVRAAYPWPPNAWIKETTLYMSVKSPGRYFWEYQAWAVFRMRPCHGFLWNVITNDLFRDDLNSVLKGHLWIFEL